MHPKVCRCCDSGAVKKRKHSVGYIYPSFEKRSKYEGSKINSSVTEAQWLLVSKVDEYKFGILKNGIIGKNKRYTLQYNMMRPTVCMEEVTV